MAEPVLCQVKNLSFRYQETLVLDNVTFDLRPGEVLGLVGPNGSGKTTLIKIMARLLKPAGGDILLEGRPLECFNPRMLARRLAWMPQDIQILYPFTVRDLVFLGRTPYTRGFGFERDEDRAIVENVMKRTGLIEIADRPVGRLSAGQKQRVILASRLAQRPRLLLLDEPMTHLDLSIQIQMMAIFCDLAKNDGIAVLMACHDLNLAAQFCDQILLLKEGRMSGLGRPSEVLTEQTIRDVYHCRVIVDPHPTTGYPRITVIPE